MNNANLLDKLHTSQINNFVKYLQSPYYNKDIELLTYAEQRIAALKYGNSKIDIHEIKEKNLEAHCLNFLVFEHIKQNKSLETQLKLSAARKRNLEKLYNGIIADIARMRNAEFDQSSDFFYNQYLIEKNLFELTTENEKKNTKVNIGASLNIDKIAFYLDIYYFLEKAKQHLFALMKMEFCDSDESRTYFFREKYDFYKEKDCPLLLILLLTGLILSNKNGDDTSIAEELLGKIKPFIHHIPVKDAQLIKAALNYIQNHQYQPTLDKILILLDEQIKLIDTI